MLTSAYLRERYGKVCVTTFPDGLRVPWKPLSIGEHTYYYDLLATQKHPNFVIENEIFRKQVVDPSILKDHNLQAGVVSTVAASILAFSGPTDPQEVDHSLNLARQRMQASMMNEFVSLICMAFPAYTPDDVYDMDYTKFMDRLALAESKLVSTGMIQQPLDIMQTGQQPEQPQPPKQERIPPEKLKEAYDNQRRSAVEQRAISLAQPPPMSPNQPQTVVTKDDMAELTAALTGQERQDVQIAGHQFIKDTASKVYAPYIEQMKKGEKLRIMTVEERVAQAKVREEENKQKVKDQKVAYKEAIRKIESKKPDRVIKFRKKRGV